MLRERCPYQPYLAAAHRSPRGLRPGTTITAKPRFGLEVGGVVQDVIDRDGRFAGSPRNPDMSGLGAKGLIYQETVPLLRGGERHAVLDLWIVGGEAKGLRCPRRRRPDARRLRGVRAARLPSAGP